MHVMGMLVLQNNVKYSTEQSMCKQYSFYKVTSRQNIDESSTENFLKV